MDRERHGKSQSTEPNPKRRSQLASIVGYLRIFVGNVAFHLRLSRGLANTLPKWNCERGVIY